MHTGLSKLIDQQIYLTHKKKLNMALVLQMSYASVQGSIDFHVFYIYPIHFFVDNICILNGTSEDLNLSSKLVVMTKFEVSFY